MLFKQSDCACSNSAAGKVVCSLFQNDVHRVFKGMLMHRVANAKITASRKTLSEIMIPAVTVVKL